MPPAPMMMMGRGRDGTRHACRRSAITAVSGAMRPIDGMHGGGLRSVQMEHPFHLRPPIAIRRVRRGLLERSHQLLPFGHARTGRLMSGEDAAEIEAVAELQDHHE